MSMFYIREQSPSPRCLFSQHPSPFRLSPSFLPSPSSLHPPLSPPRPQRPNNLRTKHLLPKPFLLQQLQRLQRRPRIREILDIFGPPPVFVKVAEIGDEGWVLEEFLGGEMVEVEGGGEECYELRRGVSVELWGWYGRRRGKRMGYVQSCV